MFNGTNDTEVTPYNQSNFGGVIDAWEQFYSLVFQIFMTLAFVLFSLFIGLINTLVVAAKTLMTKIVQHPFLTTSVVGGIGLALFGKNLNIVDKLKNLFHFRKNQTDSDLTEQPDETKKEKKRKKEPEQTVDTDSEEENENIGRKPRRPSTTSKSRTNSGEMWFSSESPFSSGSRFYTPQPERRHPNNQSGDHQQPSSSHGSPYSSRKNI